MKTFQGAVAIDGLLVDLLSNLRQKKWWEILLPAVLWSIWWNQNSRKFRGEFLSPFNITGKAIWLMEDWASGAGVGNPNDFMIIQRIIHERLQSSHKLRFPAENYTKKILKSPWIKILVEKPQKASSCKEIKKLLIDIAYLS